MPPTAAESPTPRSHPARQGPYCPAEHAGSRIARRRCQNPFGLLRQGRLARLERADLVTVIARPANRRGDASTVAPSPGLSRVSPSATSRRPAPPAKRTNAATRAAFSRAPARPVPISRPPQRCIRTPRAASSARSWIAPSTRAQRAHPPGTGHSRPPEGPTNSGLPRPASFMRSPRPSHAFRERRPRPLDAS